MKQRVPPKFGTQPGPFLPFSSHAASKDQQNIQWTPIRHGQTSCSIPCPAIPPMTSMCLESYGV